MSKKPRPELEFHKWSSKPLHELLGLQPPPFVAIKPFRQLEYIRDHVATLGCKTIVLESHYIDRHYIEDHSIFYSKDFVWTPNFCRRLHFFTQDEAEVRKHVEAIIKAGRSQGKSAYKRACDEFSKAAYLGFSVIKPLDGSPVGRTVLRCYGEQADGTMRRVFSSIRRYEAHVMGCELRVQGLAFQQQDVGVSACATTALWSSLQQERQFEKIRPATPAQITMLASQNALPFGKPMPSEGLSVDQMCQATQSLGVPPNLIRVEKNFLDARAHLHSATLSGFAPVLIMELVNDPEVRHAVTVAGIKIDSSFKPVNIPSIDVDRSTELSAVYYHDDRFGPYVRADVTEHRGSLVFEVDYRGKASNETWELTHILVPMHSKIRVSFAGIRTIAKQLVIECAKKLKELIKASSIASFPKIIFQTRIERSTEYVEDLVYEEASISTDGITGFVTDIALSRYVGVVRLKCELFGEFDLLIDTTSTLHNIHYLCVVFRGSSKPYTKEIAEWLSKEAGCPAVL